MNAPVMRAKLMIHNVVVTGDGEGNTTSEQLSFMAVGSNVPYNADGTGDEDSTFSRWTPCANLTMLVQNPDLFGQFKAGDKLYVDFTRAD